MAVELVEVGQVFQSTLSMRRATSQAGGETAETVISIHALHEESDSHIVDLPVLVNISIHALHEESDSPRPANSASVPNFNPRSP